jgi:hypothetical protein
MVVAVSRLALSDYQNPIEEELQPSIGHCSTRELHLFLARALQSLKTKTVGGH